MALQIFWNISLHSEHTPPLFIEGVRILENHRGGNKDFLLKGGWGISGRGLSIEGEGDKHCFSSIVYGFCSSNANYSESILINQCSQYEKTWLQDVRYLIQYYPCTEMHLVIQLCSIPCSSCLI